MKQIIGLLFIVAAIISFFGINITCVVWVVMDIINMVKSTEPVTFFQLAWMVFLLITRELLAAIVACVLGFLGLVLMQD